MVVYLDTLILENYIVNLFLLYITLLTLRKSLILKRILLSAFIGSIYTLVLIYKELFLFTYLPFKILTVYIMILIAISDSNLIFRIKASLIYIVYSMLLAGICIYFQYNEYKNSNFNNIELDFDTKKLLLSIICISIFIYRMVFFIKDRIDIYDLVYDVLIVHDKSAVKIKAFLDTGNELREPATNLPVMIVFKDILPDFKIMEENKYIVAYGVLNGYGGELEGFRPDYILLNRKGKIKKRNVIIVLSERNPDLLRDYDALLSRGII